jgi:hypothetical protein
LEERQRRKQYGIERKERCQGEREGREVREIGERENSDVRQKWKEKGR